MHTSDCKISNDHRFATKRTRPVVQVPVSGVAWVLLQQLGTYYGTTLVETIETLALDATLTMSGSSFSHGDDGA